MPLKKTPATPGIDPGTFRLVAQCLNHCATFKLWRHNSSFFFFYLIATAVLQLKICDFQDKLLNGLKCCNFLWVQRRHNCSPAVSFENCVMTSYLLKVHLHTFLYIPVTQKYQILSCDTLVANERYIYDYLAAISNSLEILYTQIPGFNESFRDVRIREDQSYTEVFRVTLTQLHSFLLCFVSGSDVIVRHPARTPGKRITYRCCNNSKGMTQRHNGRKWLCSSLLSLINAANLGFNLLTRLNSKLYLCGPYRVTTLVLICVVWRHEECDFYSKWESLPSFRRWSCGRV
jgi:hypothetical protein